MPRFVFYIFAVWFLAIPFTIVSKAYLGFISIDKLLAPILVTLWFLFLIIGGNRFDQKKFSLIFVAFAFFFIRSISKIDNFTVYVSLIWEDSVRFGYFCVPILFIDNLQKIKAVGKLVSVNAVVACVSAFLVAIGWLTLPYERFAESRIDLNIQKSVGLLTAYGDVAQLSAFFLLLMLFVPPGKKLRAGKTRGVLAFIIVLLGLMGNQSRSMFLSLIVALVMALLFHFRSRNPANRMLYNMLFLSGGISVAAIVAVAFSKIVELLSSLGGAEAAGTAMGRLEQYQWAFGLIKEYPILGVNGAFYYKFGDYVHGVHDMWLGQLVRGGFVSTFVLLGLLSMIFRRALRLLDNPQTKPYGIVLIGHMSAVLVSTLFYPADSSIFWLLLGVSGAIVTTLRSGGRWSL